MPGRRAPTRRGTRDCSCDSERTGRQRRRPRGSRTRPAPRPWPADRHYDPARGRSRTSEEAGVGLGVGQVEGGAVHRDQPQPAIPGTGRPLGRHRPAHPGEQLLQRLRTQPQPGPPDRRRARHPPRALPTPSPLQALRQQPGDLLIALTGEQAHRQHEIDHHPRGQQPTTLLAPPALLDDLIDQLRREHPREHTDRDPVRQPPLRQRLQLSRPWHTTPNDPHPSKSPVSTLGVVRRCQRANVRSGQATRSAADHSS